MERKSIKAQRLQKQDSSINIKGKPGKVKNKKMF
jgi:hypothetical protein